MRDVDSKLLGSWTTRRRSDSHRPERPGDVEDSVETEAVPELVDCESRDPTWDRADGEVDEEGAEHVGIGCVNLIAPSDDNGEFMA